MNPGQQITTNTSGTGGAVHLTISAVGSKTTPEDPELVMEEIWLRATQVGSVLENILREPHGEPRWGLNE